MVKNPFEECFYRILSRAAKKGASDIHIEPFDNVFLVKFRIDSILQVFEKQEDLNFIKRLKEVIKKCCLFDMGVSGFPQDARFSIPGIPFDYRASLCPVMHGEKIVLRLLEQNKVFDLKTYKLREDAKNDLNLSLKKSQGMIVVSGPTGSGKSTLLYSALGAIDRVKKNVHTIEDPIEYNLENLNQTQVIKGKMGFADVIRSLMRQDPDVLLIGEIRDRETAQAAIHAASTGHLVLTTVHANSAAEIEERLEGLGVKRELFAANVLYSSAQRLMPKLCPHCLEDDPDSMALVEAVYGVKVLPKKGKGCEKCNAGIKGRVLLFEWIMKEKNLAEKSKLEKKGCIPSQALEFLKGGVIDASSACSIF